jgi:hypothetical protein
VETRRGPQSERSYECMIDWRFGLAGTAKELPWEGNLTCSFSISVCRFPFSIEEATHSIALLSWPASLWRLWGQRDCVSTRLGVTISHRQPGCSGLIFAFLFTYLSRSKTSLNFSEEYCSRADCGNKPRSRILKSHQPSMLLTGVQVLCKFIV